MHKPLMIVKVYNGIIGRIQFPQAHPYPFYTLGFQHAVSLAAYIIGNLRQTVDATRQRIDIHHRASAHHGIVTVGKLHIQQSQCVFLEPRCTVILIQPEASHQMMPHQSLLVSRR